MTDLQTLVRQTSNPSILKMQQRLHEEVLVLGKQALEWKATCEALQLALEVERDAANLYAKQVAHWIGKHDALLEQQLAQPEQRTAGCTLCGHCAATGEKIQAAQPVAQPLTVQEVEQILHQHNYELHGDRARYIVRMTERAHGIGAKK